MKAKHSGNWWIGWLLGAGLLLCATGAAFGTQNPEVTFTRETPDAQTVVWDIAISGAQMNSLQVTVAYDPEVLVPLKANRQEASTAKDMTEYADGILYDAWSKKGLMSSIAELKKDEAIVDYVMYTASTDGSYIDTGTGLDLMSLRFGIKEGASLKADSLKLAATDSNPEGLLMYVKDSEGIGRDSEYQGSALTIGERASFALTLLPKDKLEDPSEGDDAGNAGDHGGGSSGAGSGVGGGNSGTSDGTGGTTGGSGTTGTNGGTTGSQTGQGTGVLTDINGHWAQSSIQALVGSGIITGFPDGTFQPENAMTRAQFAVVLTKALGLHAQGAATFSDAKGHWAESSIAAATEAGFLSGISDTIFDPNAELTREQMFLIISKAKSLTGSKTPEQLGLFTDDDEISSWARAGIYQTKEAGILSGYPDGSMKPKASVKRCEVAATIQQLR